MWRTNGGRHAASSISSSGGRGLNPGQLVGGNGMSIYRPAGRINTPGFLRGMVEQCNTEMNLGLFPDEVSAIAAVLNRDHYRFK